MIDPSLNLAVGDHQANSIDRPGSNPTHVAVTIPDAGARATRVQTPLRIGSGCEARWCS
jgi:hypothetical protein